MYPGALAVIDVYGPVGTGNTLYVPLESVAFEAMTETVTTAPAIGLPVDASRTVP